MCLGQSHLFCSWYHHFLLVKHAKHAELVPHFSTPARLWTGDACRGSRGLDETCESLDQALRVTHHIHVRQPAPFRSIWTMVKSGVERRSIGQGQGIPLQNSEVHGATASWRENDVSRGRVAFFDGVHSWHRSSWLILCVFSFFSGWRLIDVLTWPWLGWWLVEFLLRSLAFQSEPKGWKAVSASDRPFGPVLGAFLSPELSCSPWKLGWEMSKRWELRYISISYIPMKFSPSSYWWSIFMFIPWCNFARFGCIVILCW